METPWQKRIKALEDKGMSQSSLAKETGATPGAISLLANGKRNSPMYDLGNRIVQLCDRLGIEVE